MNVVAFSALTRDPEILDELLRLARDKSVGSLTRVLSIGGALRMLDSRVMVVGVDEFTKTREGGTCIIDGPPHKQPFSGGPLPSDSVERVRRALLPLERSASTDSMVRSAAHCTLNFLRMRELHMTSTLAEFDPGKYELTYVCGRRYRIVSRARYSFAAYFTDRGKVHAVRLPAVSQTGEPVNADFETEGDEPVRLFVDGERIATASNGKRPCT